MRTRNILLAVAVVLILLALVYYYWWVKDTIRLSITSGSFQVSTVGAISFAYTTPSTVAISSWVGKKITLYTSSLGTIVTTVGAVSTAGVLTTAAGAYSGTTAYVYAAGDYARLVLKY